MRLYSMLQRKIVAATLRVFNYRRPRSESEQTALVDGSRARAILGLSALYFSSLPGATVLPGTVTTRCVCKPPARKIALPSRTPLANANKTMNGAPVIHIVDDDTSFRTAISRVLKVSGYEVADYDSATRFLRAIEDARPGCILLDVKMPALGGLELQEELVKLSLRWPIIFMTGHGDIPTSVRAIKAGAEDFLSKPVSKQTLLEAIERALDRHASIQQHQDRLNSLKSLISALTARENEVFALMARGKLNKQIAHQLGTSERTIKAHRHVVMHKLRVQSFAEAVSIAERVGLLAPSASPDAKDAS
jgi:FixJ family two-component response regulator